jgi:poly(hydroxyalkanoate) granule-associated protein
MATRKRSGSGDQQRSADDEGPAVADGLVGGVQQLLLAGMGAVARAQREGPAAFTEAVTEGLKLLGKSREGAEKLVRDALDAAQDTVHARFSGAREQVGETWDNLELLFQTRVQRALQQIGVPNAEEIRLLTRRVAELNEAVKALTVRVERGAEGRARAPRKAATRKAAVRKTAAAAARKRRRVARRR